MSERLPGPLTPEKEPQPMYDNCTKCNKRYEITKANGAVYSYTKQPECNWMYCLCPTCKSPSRIFIEGNWLDNCRLAGLNVLEEEEYANEKIYNDWLSVKGIELAKTYELTNRQEKLIGEFATVLANTPDEYLYDLIVDDGYDKPYPQRWIS